MVYLDQIGIPRIAGNSQVVIALFLNSCQTRPSWKGAKHESWDRTLRVGRPKTWRYLDALTKRPAMVDNFSLSCMRKEQLFVGELTVQR